MEIGRTTKMKNAEKKKRTFWQKLLAQLYSQIVSLFVFCVSFNFAIFAENTIKNRGFSKTNLKLKCGPS